MSLVGKWIGDAWEVLTASATLQIQTSCWNIGSWAVKLFLALHFKRGRPSFTAQGKEIRSTTPRWERFFDAAALRSANITIMDRLGN